MKKATIVMQPKDNSLALASLAGLGILHVEHCRPAKSKNLSLLEEEAGLVNLAQGILSSPQYLDKNCQQVDVSDWPRIARHIIDCQKRVDYLEEYGRTLGKLIAFWQDWGDFDPHQLSSLAEENIHLGLYQVAASELKNFPADAIVRVISKKGRLVNCLLISQKKPQLDLKALELPKLSLNQMRQRLKLDTETLSRIKDDIRKHSVYRQALGRANAKLTQEIVFQQALDGMGSSQGVSFIRGYIPQEHEKKILSHAKESGWGILIEEVRDEDDPPTLLRNPGWVELISPVFRLLEIIPGYRELDISPVFLIFLGLFFGMIIGDAGYACVYVVLTYLAQKKFGPRLKSKKIFFLLYFFSGCAFFWGLLTGVAFGQGWFLRAGFRPITPLLNDTKFLQTFCFFLGAFHLSLAHLWQLARKLPSPGALCDLGWILILWAAFFLARTLILNSPYPFFGNWLVISGICLVVICTRPQRNIFKMLIQGLGTLALSLVNNFTDVVSYVRLFAVGLAGIAIADTVNAIASQFGSSSRLAAAIIVLIGHSINLLLGPLSVLVHGVRLNVLEFSSHLGLSWSGVSYKPLKA